MTNLFSTFNESNYSEWENKIIKDLKGIELNSLDYNTLENIKIKPIYFSDENNSSKNYTLNKSKKDWDVFTQITDESLLNFYEVDGLIIDLAENKPNKNYKNLLISKDPNSFKNYLNESKETLFKLDIYGNLFETGNWFSTKLEDEAIVANIVKNARPEKIICINNSIFQNAGATITQQLAFALCHANDYIERFGKEIISRIYFNFSVAGNFFFEIAKLRAFRFLWDSFLESKNISSEAYLLIETSLRNKSELDKDNNTIRNTLECCASILGRSNGILVNSHEITSANKSEFSLELAHKIQLILKKESFFNEFLDPIAGNYYVESITDQLIENASILFKEIEKNGGLITGMKNGSIQKMIDESNLKEIELFNNKNNILIGVNKYKAENIDFSEDKIETIAPKNTLIQQLIPFRLSQEIE